MFAANYLASQKQFWKEVPAFFRFAFLVVLLLQTGFGIYYLCEIPLHYDEWYSFGFSRSSFKTILSFYPSNNNHIFFNLLARLCLLCAIPPEIAVRIPALLASLAASYYFFKMAVPFFRPFLSLLLLCLMVSSYWIVLYSFMGRGYSLQHLFCILCMYASQQLCLSYRQSKYRALLILSSVLGLLTVPSFVYTLCGILPPLFVFVFFRQKKGSAALFTLDVFISLLLALLVYLPVLLNNDLDVLLNPIGSSERLPFSDPEAFEKILNYLNLLFHEISGSEHLYVFTILIATAFIYRLIKSRSVEYLPSLAFFMFLSPLFIILIHRLFPFGRNWLYMVSPTLLCLGLVIRWLSDLLPQKNIPLGTLMLITALFVSFSAFRFMDFRMKHRRETAWDYQLDFLRKKILGADIRNIQRIASTQSGFEFYPVEVIKHHVAISGKEYREPSTETMSPATSAELLVLSQDQRFVFSNTLRNYRLLYAHAGMYFYLKTDQ